MSDSDSKLGKKFRGQTFVPVKTEDDVRADIALQKDFKTSDAVSIDVFFARRGVRDPVSRAGMLAYTKVRTASMDAWTKIFETY